MVVATLLPTILASASMNLKTHIPRWISLSHPGYLNLSALAIHFACCELFLQALNLLVHVSFTLHRRHGAPVLSMFFNIVWKIVWILYCHGTDCRYRVRDTVACTQGSCILNSAAAYLSAWDCFVSFCSRWFLKTFITCPTWQPIRTIRSHKLVQL